MIKKGDYVLATKYNDGDPKDHFVVGFYNGMTNHKPPRFKIVDHDGSYFRQNGFRRIKKISPKRGKWIVDRITKIESSDKSLWWWVKQKMKGDL